MGKGWDGSHVECAEAIEFFYEFSPRLQYTKGFSDPADKDEVINLKDASCAVEGRR